MRLYHLTTTERAAAILASGFEDDVYPSGVYLAELPVSESHDLNYGDVAMVIDLDVEESDLADLELGKGKPRPYRDWRVPAALINERGAVRLTTAAEDEECVAEAGRRLKRSIESARPPERPWVEVPDRMDKYVILNEAEGRELTAQPYFHEGKLRFGFYFDPPLEPTDRVHTTTTLLEPATLLIAVSVESPGGNEDDLTLEDGDDQL